METSKTGAAAIRLCLQTIVAAFVFAVVFLVAVALAGIVHYVEGLGIAPKWLTNGAKQVEVAIFVTDCILFAFYVLAEVVRFIRTMIADMRDG